MYDEKQKPLKFSLLWNHCLISFVQYCNQTRKSYDPSKSIRMFERGMRRTRQISKQRKRIDLYNCANGNVAENEIYAFGNSELRLKPLRFRVRKLSL